MQANSLKLVEQCACQQLFSNRRHRLNIATILTPLVALLSYQTYDLYQPSGTRDSASSSLALTAACTSQCLRSFILC